MVMTQGRRLFFRYGDFPLSIRVLFTGALVVLGIGYLFAMAYMYESHAGRDGKPGLSEEDLVIAYSGSKEDSRLEAALKGPMRGMLPAEERGRIISWVRHGAKEAQYEAEVKPIVQKRCLACHDGSNPHIPNLSTYKGLHEFAALDTGMSFSTLVRVSHIHLFGLTFIFFIVGWIFTYAAVRPLWLKSAVVALPFVSIVLDVASWYLTKLYTSFAWVVIASGAVMGLCFGFMWVVSIYQMWFRRLSSEVPSQRVRPA